MKTTFDHLIDPAFYLWMDNLLINKNQCFTNYSGALYTLPYDRNNLNGYKSPHSQWVYDSTISGANVPTGIYSNGSFIPRGTGLSLDFQRGAASSVNIYPNTTAAYAYKEVNLYFTNEEEQDIIFDGRLSSNPRTDVPPTGSYNLSDWMYPCMFIRNQIGANTPLTFDGMTSTIIPIRATLISDRDALFKLVLGACRDASQTYLSTMQPQYIPFTPFGDLKNGSFNYTATAKLAPYQQLIFVKDVSISVFSAQVNKLIAPRVLGAFIDFNLEVLRFPNSP